MHNTMNTGELVELYWDIILLTEAQFLVSSINMKQFKLFRKKYLIDKISLKLNSNNNKISNKGAAMKKIVAIPPDTFRSMADEYICLYLPLHYKKIIWCKKNSIYLHVILSNLDFNLIENCKEWLLIFLEITNKLNCEKLRLYINRNFNWKEFHIFLRNLNWIGARIIKNEFRDDIENLDDLLLSDEEYIILEFDC